MAIEKAEHSRLIASNKTHNMWERWDGCQVVDAKGPKDDEQSRRDWCFYPRGTFRLGALHGFEWANPGALSVAEPTGDGVGETHTTPVIYFDTTNCGPKPDPYVEHRRELSARLDSESPELDVGLATLERRGAFAKAARARNIAALAAEMRKPVTPRFPAEGRSDRVTQYRRWSDK